MTQTVLVTGGAGYIGSHACKVLARAGYQPVTYDSLVTGWQDAVKFGPFEQGDLADRARLDQVFAHPQVIHREMQVNHPHSSGTTAPLVANPIKFSGTKIEYAKGPPRRGEDTANILKSILKYDSAAIQDLSERRIIDIGRPEVG